MRFRLYAPAADAAGGTVLALALALALWRPGRLAVRLAWALGIGGAVWLYLRLYVRCACWGVRGGALYLCTGVAAARVQLLSLDAVTALHCRFLPGGGCVLRICWRGGGAVLPFVCRADAQALQRCWQQGHP